MMTESQPFPERFEFADYDLTLELRERQVPPAPTSQTGSAGRAWRAYRWMLTGSDEGRKKLYHHYPDLTEEGKTLYFLLLTVALEWVPSPAYLAQLRRAFRLASDYLYDATDGQMALGEIEFVGYEERERAHILLLASNRVHPRCQMEGLHHAIYPSITLGRGLWLPRYEMSLPWDEPEGYRTIIHEVAHAALGLADAYLTRIAIDLATGRQLPRQTRDVPKLWLPAYTPDSYSMMGWPLIGSELHHAEVQIRKLFVLDEPTEQEEEDAPTEPTTTASTRIKYGPLGLPLPLPQYHGSLLDSGQEEIEGEQLLKLRGTFAIRHYDEAWLYLWRQDKGRLLPQGTCLLPPRPGEPGYDAQLETGRAADTPAPRTVTFPVRHNPGKVWVQSAQSVPQIRSYKGEVVGGRAGDVLLMVIEEADKATHVYQGILGDPAQEEHIVEMSEVTPPAPLPMLCVVPTENKPEIHIAADGPLPDALWLFPLGAAEGIELKNPTAAADGYRYAVPDHYLDGHLLTRWGSEEAGRYLVTMFSQGGTGPGHDQVTSPPSAGAMDGNVVVFFGERPPSETQEEEPPEENKHPLVLLTTQGHHPMDEERLGGGPVILASNQSLAVGYEPTLVFFYQGSALGAGEYFDYRPTIERWGEGGVWMPVSPVYVTTRRLIAAMPLNADNAPNLFAKAGGIERYRLMWGNAGRSDS